MPCFPGDFTGTLTADCGRLLAMPAISLVTAESKLALWLDAEAQLALGQAVSFEGRTLTRASLAEVRQQISYWEERVNRASRGAGRTSIQRVISSRG